MPQIEGVEVVPGQWAPLLRVDLEISGALMKDVLALLDSGADKTLIPGDYLEGHPDGVLFDSLTLSENPGHGAGGDFDIRVCPGNVTWREEEICNPLEMAAPGNLPFPLLGRDFFQKCVVRFNWNRNPPVVSVDLVGKGKKGKRRF